MPNPYYIDELKELTGLDKPVQEFVMGHAEAGEFLERLESMLDFLIPNYVKEGKYQLVVAIGCTGGHHRSVTIAEELFKRIDKLNYPLIVKPAALGSSIGIRVVKQKEDLDTVVNEVFKFDRKIVVEEKIDDVLEYQE